MTIIDPPATTCATCAERARKGYCAPARCYCGHADCYAFESYIDLTAIPLADLPSAPSKCSSWDDREGSTWIDKL